MKALAVVIGIVFAAAAAALAVALAFPDRFADYLPEVLQPSVEGGPQLVVGVEPDGADIGQAVAESIRVIERRLNDLGVRFKVQCSRKATIGFCCAWRHRWTPGA